MKLSESVLTRVSEGVDQFLATLEEKVKRAKKMKLKPGELPGPLIGWLMSQGIIKRGTKKGKKGNKKYGKPKISIGKSKPRGFKNTRRG